MSRTALSLVLIFIIYVALIWWRIIFAVNFEIKGNYFYFYYKREKKYSAIGLTEAALRRFTLPFIQDPPNFDLVFCLALFFPHSLLGTQEYYCTALSLSALSFKGVLSGLRQFLATESPLKMMKNAFYFISKALFLLKIFKFLSWGHEAKWLD